MSLIPTWGFGLEGENAPSIASVTRVSPTVIRITFDRAMRLNVALVTAANYVIDPSLVVLNVTPEPVAQPTYVDLTLEEQLQGESYDIEAQRIEGA